MNPGLEDDEYPGGVRRSASNDCLSQELNYAGAPPCQLEPGRWTLDTLNQLIVRTHQSGLHAPDRVSRIAWAFKGTPFQFESQRPLPLAGRVPVRLDAFDCMTFVYTSLAAAASQGIEDFLRNLYTLRYSDADSGRIDNDPASGNIFDFAEESLMINAINRGLLKDVTSEVANGAPLKHLSSVLLPAQRSRAVDPLKLWAAPKLGDLPVGADFIPVEEFRCLAPPTKLMNGDLILMSRGDTSRGYFIDHVGIARVEAQGTFLLQATRHFAWQPEGPLQSEGAYTGIFYDTDRKKEQIGIGIAGEYAGDSVAFIRAGLPYFGYHADTRRSLRDYLSSIFKYVLILRPIFP